MPYSGVPKRLTKKMERCVARVMKDGEDKSSAIAICKESIMSAQKDWSLYQRGEVIRMAWWDSGYGNETPYPYIYEIFDKYVIVKVKGKFAKVKYSFNNGDPEFAEPQEWKQVEVEYKSGLLVARRVARNPIKFVEGSELEYECHGILYGSRAKRDLEGTFFTKDTNFYLDWHTQWPWLYHHGMNKHVSLDNVGLWKSAVPDDVGVFMRGELDSRHRYLEQVQELLDDGDLFPSSGTFNYMMKVAEDGEILDWPVGELSSTVAPAEFRMNPISQRAAKALETLGGM